MMKQHLLHSLGLRLCALIVLVLFAAGSAWAQTTYKLEQVTSVEAGGLYVFEQTYNGTSYVMKNTISSNALTTTTNYKTTGLVGNEIYVWTLETAKDGYYLKNVNRSSSAYLNNASSTNMSFGNKSSIWAFNFKEDHTVMIQNKSNSNRFLGFYYGGGSVTTNYKAYATGSVNESTYPHAIKVFKLVPEFTATLNAYGYATFASTSALDFSDYETADYSTWAVKGISGTSITFEQITGAIPAGTGMLLMGTAGATVNFNVTNEEGTAIENLLEGVTSEKTISADEYYGLSGNKFVKVNAGTVPAGKALLPTSVVNGANVKALTFVFEGADGIETTLSSQPSAHNLIYNLAGQRVNKATKGIYVINGKKVLVK